jgi:hypothetical protein
MAVWDELKTVLTDLRERDPQPLTSYPTPESDEGRQPPIEIGLAAWATQIAEQLHQRFGDQVALTVGALRYPQRTLVYPPAPPMDAAAPQLDPGQARIAWAAPLRIRSGFSERHEMAITNTGTEQINANGPLIADVVDPDTGEVVGGYAGAVTLVLVTVTVAPGATTRTPVIVGTDQTTLGLAGRQVRTPILPITITAGPARETNRTQ